MDKKAELLNKISKDIKEYCDTFNDFSFHREKPIVRLHEPTFAGEEIMAAVETMLSTQVTMGKKVKLFEQQCSNYFGSKYSLMNNSGSSANLLAFAALTNPVTENRLMPGDEVIVPALSWSTTVWPLVQCNLVPVMVDCQLDSLNIDLNKLEAAIGPKTRAIMLVHVYGNPCNMDDVMALAKKYHLQVIEDCCEAMGALYNNKAVGTFGRVGSYSFYFSHHITTLEGGINVTDDFELLETMRVLRAHGWSREAEGHIKYVEKYPSIDPRFIFINLGYNLRPTEVQAAMGMVQLPKLDTFVNERRVTAQYFLKELSRYSEFFRFQQETPRGKNVWFGFPLILKEDAPFTLKEITSYLQKQGIETRPIIAGNMARHPAFELFEHRIGGDLSCADTVMQRGFAIANHQAVDKNARQYVIEIFDAFMQPYIGKNVTHEQAYAER